MKIYRHRRASAYDNDCRRQC